MKKTLFKQGYKDSLLAGSGITTSFFNYFMPEKEIATAQKLHHHAFFEMHAVLKGAQTYSVDGKEYVIDEKNFIVLFPYVPHKVVYNKPGTEKIGITFYFNSNVKLRSFYAEVGERLRSNIEFSVAETNNRKEISDMLIENSILEIIVEVFRMMGHKEKDRKLPTYDENAILSLARQYVCDNIESFPTVADVAEYCHLSTKQLTRIFRSNGLVSPGEYITLERVACIEKMLLEDKYSLKEISEIMSFSSEYYLNSFVKRHLGMPPGTYRKMMEK